MYQPCKHSDTITKINNVQSHEFCFIYTFKVEINSQSFFQEEQTTCPSSSYSPRLCSPMSSLIKSKDSSSLSHLLCDAGAAGSFSSWAPTAELGASLSSEMEEIRTGRLVEWLCPTPHP